MSKTKILSLLNQDTFSKNDLVYLLSFYNKDEKQLIFEKSKEIKQQFVGNKIYLRGLIEYSNKCTKDCFYCGIRAHNHKVERYTVSDADVLNCADYAYKNNYASIVIQSGETKDKVFIHKITQLLEQIHQKTKHALKVTLSCGEQSPETYKTWFEAGAHRYLLRLESSVESIYNTIHPNDEKHSYENRIQALKDLQTAGYQVGSGFMIGLPKQSLEDLASDLLFLQDFNIDMVGMGPYVEHIETPMYKQKDFLIPQEDRYHLTLLMYALLRIMMKDVNIASTTALDALNPTGRIEALSVACNVLMPNLTPIIYTSNYHLYNNKPDSLHSDKLVAYIEKHKTLHGNNIAFGEHGNSKHFENRKND